MRRYADMEEDPEGRGLVLRSRLPMEVTDAMYSMEISGIRQTYYREGDDYNSGVEVKVGTGRWLDIDVWIAHDYYHLLPEQVGNANVPPPHRIPLIVFDHVRSGKISEVVQRVRASESVENEVNVDVFVRKNNDEEIPLYEYLHEEAATIDMCLPMSKQESHMFFDDMNIIALRHTFVISTSTHTVQILPDKPDPVWETVPTPELNKWRDDVPHFLLTYRQQSDDDELVLRNKSPLVNISDIPTTTTGGRRTKQLMRSAPVKSSMLSIISKQFRSNHQRKISEPVIVATKERPLHSTDLFKEQEVAERWRRYNQAQRKVQSSTEHQVVAADERIRKRRTSKDIYELREQWLTSIGPKQRTSALTAP